MARHLVERSSLFRNALLALCASVGLLALGSFAGGVINLWFPAAVWLTGTFTLLGILCVLWAALQLVREAWTCMEVISEHGERVAETRAPDDDGSTS